MRSVPFVRTFRRGGVALLLTAPLMTLAVGCGAGEPPAGSESAAVATPSLPQDLWGRLGFGIRTDYPGAATARELVEASDLIVKGSVTAVRTWPPQSAGTADANSETVLLNIAVDEIFMADQEFEPGQVQVIMPKARLVSDGQVVTERPPANVGVFSLARADTESPSSSLFVIGVDNWLIDLTSGRSVTPFGVTDAPPDALHGRTAEEIETVIREAAGTR